MPVTHGAGLTIAVDWQALSAVATAIAALGTTVAVIIAALALRATARAATAAERQVVAAHRPLILAVPQDSSDPRAQVRMRSLDGATDFTLMLRNAGSGIARVTSAYLESGGAFVDLLPHGSVVYVPVGDTQQLARHFEAGPDRDTLAAIMKPLTPINAWVSFEDFAAVEFGETHLVIGPWHQHLAVLAEYARFYPYRRPGRPART